MVALFRAGFNRSGFNRAGVKVEFSGAAAMSLSGEAIGSLRISPFPTAVKMALDALGQAQRKLHAADVAVPLSFEVDGVGTGRIFAVLDEIRFDLDADGQPVRLLHAERISSELSLNSTAIPKVDIYASEITSRFVLLPDGRQTVRLQSTDLHAFFGINSSATGIGRIFMGLEPVVMNLDIHYDRTASGAAELALFGSIAAGLRINAVESVVGFGLDILGSPTVKLFSPNIGANLNLHTAGLGRRRFFTDTQTVAEMSLGAAGGLSYIVFAQGTGRFGLGANAEMSRVLEIRSDLQVAFYLGAASWITEQKFAADLSAQLTLGTFGAHLTNRWHAALNCVEMSLDVDGALSGIHDAPQTKSNLNLNALGLATRRLSVNALDHAAFNLDLFGYYSQRMWSLPIKALVNLGAGGLLSAKYYAGGKSVLVLDLAGNFMAAGFSTINLPGLVIPSGGELVIDTAEMTVMLNGQDVTRFFGADSEFFKFSPGENVVVYTDSAINRNAAITFLWRDLWV